MHRITIRAIFLTIFLSIVINSFSQPFEVHPPLKIPLLLSGNFGELRGTHFHAGIDIKTQGVTGIPVYTAAKGYVSRFKVQSGGYGHAIYITHENGYTSVYAHLDEFYPELENYLKEEQYRRKTFEIDVYTEKNQFPVTAGQQIGLSGNTGRSMGPHLHYEIRNSNQVPQNVLKYKLPVKDTISPKFRKLAVYNHIDTITFSSLHKMLFTTTGKGGNYTVSSKIPVNGYTAFGVEVYDYLNGSNNKCGIYDLQFLIDSVLIYSFVVENISFNETRYIKSHLDYAEKKVNKRNVHKLFREPNNRLSIYKTILNSGLIQISDTLEHAAQIITRDVYGNASTLNFTLVFDPSVKNSRADTGMVFVPFDKGITYKNEVFSITIPPNALYSNKWLTYFILPESNGYFSEIHLIGDEYVPVNKYPELSIKVTKPTGAVAAQKLVLAKFNEDGTLKSEGGHYNNGEVTARISGFGKYVVAADTIAPKIIPVSFKSGSWYAPNNTISFEISDELSGIKTYNGYIDGEWVLFEYDAKSDLLFYTIDKERLARTKGKHNLKLYVLDERNNLQKFEGEFYY